MPQTGKWYADQKNEFRQAHKLVDDAAGKTDGIRKMSQIHFR